MDQSSQTPACPSLNNCVCIPTDKQSSWQTSTWLQKMQLAQSVLPLWKTCSTACRTLNLSPVLCSMVKSVPAASETAQRNTTCSQIFHSKIKRRNFSKKLVFWETLVRVPKESVLWTHNCIPKHQNSYINNLCSCSAALPDGCTHIQNACASNIYFWMWL